MLVIVIDRKAIAKDIDNFKWEGLGHRLRTYQNLADATGISVTTLWRIANGKGPVSSESAIKLGYYFRGEVGAYLAIK